MDNDNDNIKRIKIEKILTVFQKTCNDEEDIRTVKNLDLNDLNNLYKLKSEELTAILNTLLPISTKIEAQINPKEKDSNSIPECLNDNLIKKKYCLGETNINELKNIIKINCPVIGGKKSKRRKQRKNNRKSKKQRNKKRR
jgi:hypothetical protein